MNFKSRSIIDLLANLTSASIVLTLAIMGYGVWALVFGPLGLHIFKAIAYNVQKKYRYKPMFSIRGMRSMLVFGGYVSVTRVLWYFYSQADMLICGKIFGKSLLGVYGVAMQLVSIPMSKISPLMFQVGFSAFSRLQADLPTVQAGFLRGVHLISVFSFPLFWGLALVAPEAIPWLLGDRWLDVVLPIQLLSLVMPIRFIGIVYGPVVSGQGRPDVIMWNMVFAIVIMPTAFFIGAQWGIVGLCLAWIIAFPVLFAIMTYRVLNTLKISASLFLKACWLPFTASAVMVAGIAVLKWTASTSAAFSFTASVVLGALLYTATTLFFNRNELVEIRSMFVN